MSLRERRMPVLLGLMTLLFGFSFIATKNALQGLGVFQVVFGRYLIAFLVLTAILWRDRRKFHIAGKDLKQFLLLTMVEPVGYFVFETFGVRYTTPSAVSLIIATIPIFSILLALWILKERTTMLAITGIILSLIGVYFIVVIQPKSQLAPKPMLGNLLTLGAALSAGFYNVLCRRLSRIYSPLTITYYQSMVATVVFLPFALFESYFNPAFRINGFILLNVLYLGVGASVAAYLILNYALSRLPVFRVAIFANLIPVVTILAAWFVYGELLEVLQLLGALFIIAGVYLTYAQDSKKIASIPPA